MHLINTFIIWIWLLGISLVIPTSLPAGGSQKSIIQHRENNIGAPLIALKDFNLFSSASNSSSVLIKVQAGTPVNVLNQKFYQLFYKRGWVNIGSSR